MTDTHSVSRVFTRSCALNSLLTPAAVQQIRTDLPVVTEICHEASLLFQSFLLNFPLASRALVKQDVWYLFMTVITTGSFPKPSTSKGQRQLLHIFYNGFLPECPQDRSLVSVWENSLVPYRNSLNLFLNAWLQSQNCNFINRKGLSPYLACRARQLASNVKTSLPKICQSWTKNFIRAHCRALDKTNVFTNNILSLLPDEPLAQHEEVVVESVLEYLINFNLNNSRERFFLLNACSKFIEVPSQIFHSVKTFPNIEGSSSKTKFIKNTCLKRIFKQCPYQKFNINRKSLKNRFNKILLKTNGNELLLTFEGKNNDSENTDELDEPPKKKRRSKNEMKSDPNANKTRETQLKGTKKCPVEDVDIQSKFYLKAPLIGVDLGQSRLCGYFLNDNQCGVIPCPTGRRYMTKPSPSKHSPNQYSVQNFNQYLNHWNLVRRKVYLESNRQKWKIIKFDNRRRKERRFRESLNKFQRLAGHPEKLYLAVGSANFPSHCRKVNRYGSARAFRNWLCYQKDVKPLSTSEFNTSKMSSCCMAENIQAGSWQMRICTECQIVYDRDISAAKNIQIKKKAELWPERYICPEALLMK
ncbi:hypothetical protein P9112_004540 [Eukaryota sp. TZLM1-RC]